MKTDLWLMMHRNSTIKADELEMQLKIDPHSQVQQSWKSFLTANCKVIKGQWPVIHNHRSVIEIKECSGGIYT